ncbi:MAG: phosphoribosylformylglycinamidine synthase, partial [Bacilli bacterium]|nr:phosphoribosylformylglycinamidine synthase [Bacilli bacterium]
VRTSTAIRPGSDAAVVVIRGTSKAIAMSADGNGRHVYLDPYVGGQLAVVEAARNVVCSGAEPIAITDCLNFGNPEKPEIYYQFSQSIDGIAEACRALGTPVISGNVSFYNETGGTDIYPTPVIGMVGLLEDYSHATTQSFKTDGNLIFVTGTAGNDLGGSEYLAAVHGVTAGISPRLNLALEVRVQKFVLTAIRSNLIRAAHDCADGGLAVALAESCIAGGIGAVVNMDSELRTDAVLFGETPSRILLEVTPEHRALLEALALEMECPITLLGQVEGDSLLIGVNESIVIDASVHDLADSWKGALPWAMN